MVPRIWLLIIIRLFIARLVILLAWFGAWLITLLLWLLTRLRSILGWTTVLRLILGLFTIFLSRLLTILAFAWWCWVMAKFAIRWWSPRSPLAFLGCCCWVRTFWLFATLTIWLARVFAPWLFIAWVLWLFATLALRLL